MKRISWVLCPNCEIYTIQKVVSIVVNKDFRQIRRRVCFDCGHRWYTIQNPEKTIDDIKAKKLSKELPGDR